MVPLAYSLLDVAKNGKTSSVGYLTDNNTSMTGAPLPRAFVIDVLSCAGDAVVRVYYNVSRLTRAVV